MTGGEGAGRFPNLGRGKRGRPQLGAPRPAGAWQLFVRGGGGERARRRGAGGPRQEGLESCPRPRRVVLLKVAAFSFPFVYPLKRGKKYKVSTQLGLKAGRLPPPRPP